MAEFFKSVVLSIGVFLGVLQPHTAPEVDARLFRDDKAIYLVAKIQEPLDSDLEDLIRSGNKVQISVAIELPDGKTVTEYHDINYNLRRGDYSVYCTEKWVTYRNPQLEVAIILFLNFDKIKLFSVAELVDQEKQDVKAVFSITLPEDLSVDGSSLWSYKHPTYSTSFTSVTEIPY
jgi:hypothetical protein